MIPNILVTVIAVLTLSLIVVFILAVISEARALNKIHKDILPRIIRDHPNWTPRQQYIVYKKVADKRERDLNNRNSTLARAKTAHGGK